MFPLYQIYFYLALLFIVAVAIYLLLKGKFKLFMIWATVMTLVIGHFALKYVRNTDPQILPLFLERYAEWFF
jgi:hypothetical protein